MIETKRWMPEAVRILCRHFGPRLLFVGLQGSYRRGEAREDSDIDILTILDNLDVNDLAAYRSLLRTLPEGEKACGFTCGQAELQAWPTFELFQFAQDTESWYGKLYCLLPEVTRRDIITGAQSGVSALYHLTAYFYVAGKAESRASNLQGLFKSFYFSMLVVHYLRHGLYAQSKKELLPLLSGDEAELLRLSIDSSVCTQTDGHAMRQLFQLLLDWTGKTLRELAVMC